jgi:hypothetical protein
LNSSSSGAFGLALELPTYKGFPLLRHVQLHDVTTLSTDFQCGNQNFLSNEWLNQFHILALVANQLHARRRPGKKHLRNC